MGITCGAHGDAQHPRCPVCRAVRADVLDRRDREADHALWMADPAFAAELGIGPTPPVPAPSRLLREGMIPRRLDLNGKGER